MTNNVTETNTQTINYIDNYSQDHKIATIIVNPTPSLNDNYLWIPEGITDNVVLCLDSIATYTQSKYAALTALQNSITNITITMHNETQHIQTEINNIEITSQQHISKYSHYHTNRTDFMYQINY